MEHSVKTFLEWAKTKPADETYQPWWQNCALGQYLTAKDVKFFEVGFSTWITPITEEDQLEVTMYLTGADEDFVNVLRTSCTFGEVVRKIEALSFEEAV